METQVIVVGAGPVGLMLAGELRLGGADVTVLERLPAPVTESRASTLHARTMEIFEQRGLLESLGTPPNAGQGHFGGLPLDLSGLPSAYPGLWKVPQTRTEELLGQWASGLGATIWRGHELREITVRPDHVEAHVAGPDGPASLRASYVVGCDGEQSAVRRLAGIPFPGKDAGRELIRADVTGIDVPARRFERHENGLAIAARTGPDTTRIMVHEFGRAPRPGTGKPRFEELVDIWSRVVGEDIGAGTPVWINAFGDASRQALRYRAGRVLLAGDAAHLQMPVGGQALNLGLQDAFNLGWKLAAQVRGQAPAGLLDSYHDERHAVGARVLTNIEAQTHVLLGGREVDDLRTVLGELLALGPVTGHLAARISGLDIRHPVGLGEHPLLGARLSYAGLTAEPGDNDGLAALLRSARGVLLDLSGNPPRGAELRRAVAGLPGRIGVAAAKAGPDSGLAESDAVLVRPDGHIVWTGTRTGTTTGTEDLETALHRWFGAPTHHSRTEALR